MSKGDGTAPEARLRGEYFAARIQCLRERHGAGAIERSLAKLAGNDREILRNLDPHAWYPLAALVRLDRAAAETVGMGDPSLFEHFGAFSSRLRNEWLGDHASLVSPHAFLARVAEEHRQFHSYGRAVYRRTGFVEAEMAYFEFPELDETQCLAVRGYLRASVETLTGAPVLIDEQLCQRRGEPCCLFWIRWKPRSAVDTDTSTVPIPTPS